MKRLSRNFHQTFIPERRFINLLLKYAASGKSGNIQDISQETGIPTGKYSGKVSPTIDYCCGMGLLTIPKKHSSIKKPELTSFGRVVFLEDPFLKTEITQWIAHLNLCSKDNGAEIWYQTFWNGAIRLGSEFERKDLENYLKTVFQATSKNIIGPLIGMYKEEASFAKCGALLEKEKRLIRRKMPIRDDYAWGYSAWLLSSMEKISNSSEQITIPQIEMVCGLRILTGWSLEDIEKIFLLVERNGTITVNRHMKPWVLKAKMPAAEAWRFLFQK